MSFTEKNNESSPQLLTMKKADSINFINKETLITPSFNFPETFELIDEKYMLIKEIGIGYTSDVYLVKEIHHGKFYAMKVLKHSQPEKMLKSFQTELNSIKACEHDNIIKCLGHNYNGVKVELISNLKISPNLSEVEKEIGLPGTSHSQSGNFNSSPYNTESLSKEICQDNVYNKLIPTHSPVKITEIKYILLELCSKMELFDYIFFTKEGLGEDLAKIYFKQLLLAVSYLHEIRNIAHRDLKTENLFLDNEFKLKLGDFGFSKQLEPLTQSQINNIYFNKSKTTVGTQGYEPPEMLEGRAYCPKCYDVFSCGVALFVMVFGFPPFRDARKTDKQYRYIYYSKEDEFWKKHNINTKVSVKLKDLINGLLRYDYNKRISLTDALNSEWLKENNLSFEAAVSIMENRYIKVIEEKRKQSVPIIIINEEYEKVPLLYSQIRGACIAEGNYIKDKFAEELEFIPEQINDSAENYNCKGESKETLIEQFEYFKNSLLLNFGSFTNLRECYTYLLEKLNKIKIFKDISRISYNNKSNQLDVTMLYLNTISDYKGGASPLNIRLSINKKPGKINDETSNFSVNFVFPESCNEFDTIKIFNEIKAIMIES